MTLKFDRAMAVFAVAVSAASLFLSWYQASATRTAQRLAVTPRIHLDFRRSNGPNARAAIWLSNVGVGPAEIKALTVTIDGQAQQSWLTTLGMIAAPTKDLEYTRFPSGTFYRPGYEGVLVKVTGPDAVAAFARAFDRRMRIGVCYCSLYGECWRVQLPQYATIDEPNGCRSPEHEMDE